MGSQRPDGGPARVQRVTFTRPAAERIANVVRQVEQGDRSAAPLTFDRASTMRNAKAFRVCTFTGEWAIGDSRVVTFRNQTTTPNTVSATNLFFPLTENGERDCAIARDGTAWYLIDVPLYTATAVFASATQEGMYVSGTAAGFSVASVSSAVVLQATSIGISVTSTATQSLITGITLDATLNTSDCTIAIGKTLTTTSVVLVTGTARATVIGATATASVVSMTATATVIGATATATFITSTVTGTFLTLEPW